MDHVAIMKKSWHLTEKILTGEKSIETRWYKNRVKPWGCINPGDTIYFKDSGEPVTVKATVEKVEQFAELNEHEIQRILNKYSADDLGTREIPAEISSYVRGKRYAIIIHLKDPVSVTPFNISKKGYGLQSAWLCVGDITNAKVPQPQHFTS